jgi:3-phenylpropionate/trans-cinnamate dioxygenase ferredoxin reductase subunit
METVSYLIVGGGLAASQAAKMIRAKDPEGSIAMVGEERDLPYDRPPLSKEFLRNEKSADALVFDPPSFYEEKKIELVLGDPVTRLDPARKSAHLNSGRAIGFDKALVATGGRPVRLEVPGERLPGVYYFRTLNDARAIAEEAGPGRRAVVVGAGFIGMEVAASLTQRGVHVTVVETSPRIWERFLDASLGGYIETYCLEKGIEFRTRDRVTAFLGSQRVTKAKLRLGDTLACDFVCIGIGITPRTEIAEAAGLEVDNGIVVDEYLRTSHPDVYAAGDVANYPDPVFGRRRRVEHWGHAEYTGQVAGLNMTGNAQVYDLLTYAWSDVFDLHIEFAGDESFHDRTLVRGHMNQGSFAVLHLKQNRLTAYFAVNTDSREFPKLQKLIRRKTDLSGADARLRDASFDLKTML